MMKTCLSMRSGMGVRASMAVLTMLAFGLGGCSNAGEGAVSGAAVGALSGLAIGSLTGGAGTGAAIGAVAGGVGGAVIGDQNRRKDEAAQAAAKQPPSPTMVAYSASPNQSYPTAQALGRLVGKWQINGTVSDGAGGTLPVTGTATGAIDKTYFLRLDLRFNDPRTGKVVEGTGVINQLGGRSLEMSNSFSTSPDLARFQGQMDESGTMFNLGEIEPSRGSRQIVIRMSTDRSWTAEMWRGGTRAESFRFTPAGQ